MKYLLFVLVTLTAFNAIGEEKEMVLKVKNGVIVSEYNSTQNLDLILVQTKRSETTDFVKKRLRCLKWLWGHI